MTTRLGLCAALVLLGASCSVISDAQQQLRYDEYDRDGDGHVAVGLFSEAGAEGDDCDDNDPNRFPGNIGSCEGIDNDCDGELSDRERPDAGFIDADGDGHGNPDRTAAACQDGVVLVGDDCDDTNPDTFPGAPELCDGEDNDCVDGLPDNEKPDSGHIDADGDGYGNPLLTWRACTTSDVLPVVELSGDCDDGDPSTYPLAPEIDSDGIDNDCDGHDWASIVYLAVPKLDGNNTVPDSLRVVALDAASGQLLWESDPIDGTLSWGIALDGIGRLWLTTEFGLAVFDEPVFDDPVAFRASPPSPIAKLVQLDPAPTSVGFWTSDTESHLLLSAGGGLQFAPEPPYPLRTDYAVVSTAIPGFGSAALYNITSQTVHETQTVPERLWAAQIADQQVYTLSDVPAAFARPQDAAPTVAAFANPRLRNIGNVAPRDLVLDSRARILVGTHSAGTFLLDAPDDTPTVVQKPRDQSVRGTCLDPLNEHGLLQLVGNSAVYRWDATDAANAHATRLADLQDLGGLGKGHDCVTTVQRDADHDGHVTARLGGDDCDDLDPSVWTCLPEPIVDADEDGEPAYTRGGRDCDDGEPTIYPGAIDHPYDGLDQDCDGYDSQPLVFIAHGLKDWGGAPRDLVAVDAKSGAIVWSQPLADRPTASDCFASQDRLTVGRVVDLAVDPSGDLYLADAKCLRVLRVHPTTSGNSVPTLELVWESNENLVGLAGLAYDGPNREVVVTALPSSKSETRVVRLSTDDGTELGRTVLPDIFAPGVAVTPDGMWLLEPGPSVDVSGVFYKLDPVLYALDPSAGLTTIDDQNVKLTTPSRLRLSVEGRITSLTDPVSWPNGEMSAIGYYNPWTATVGGTAVPGASPKRAHCPSPVATKSHFFADDTGAWLHVDTTTRVVDPVAADLLAGLPGVDVTDRAFVCAGQPVLDADHDGIISRFAGGDDCDDYDENVGACSPP